MEEGESLVDWAEIHTKSKSHGAMNRMEAAMALGRSFLHLTDKTSAWKDLIRLIRDDDSVVLWQAASALGSAFQYLPDKDSTWEDLIRLTSDNNRDVSAAANHSLGLCRYSMRQMQITSSFLKLNLKML